MTKPNAGARLTSLVARAEGAAERNRAQRETIRAAANGMADHATAYLVGLHARASAGDVEALRQLRVAARGRARARRVASS